MEEDLITRMRADAAIQTIAGQRVFWVQRSENSELPALVLSLVTGGIGYDHGGAIDLQTPIVQADAYAHSFGKALLLQRAVLNLLAPPATVGSTAFGEAFQIAARSMPVEALAGQPVFRSSADYQFSFENVQG